MPVFTESTHLTENVEPFRNVCGMWVYIKTRCMSPRYYHRASTAFIHTVLSGKGHGSYGLNPELREPIMQQLDTNRGGSVLLCGPPVRPCNP